MNASNLFIYFLEHQGGWMLMGMVAAFIGIVVYLWFME